MASELDFPHNISLEWFQNNLQISKDVLDTLLQDVQDTLRKSGISETSRLNTKVVKVRVEREVLPQIREAYASVFEPFTDKSATKCLWNLVLKVQMTARRSTAPSSQATAPSTITQASCTPSTRPEVSLQDILIRLLCTKTNIATIVSPRDLVPSGDPVINNVLYERLEDIAITDLAFDKVQYNIVFADPDGTDYILRNDRNLRTALLSISQTARNSAGQKGVFKIQPKSNITMLDRTLEATEAEETVFFHQSPLADRSLARSPTLPPSHPAQGSEECASDVTRATSRLLKRRRVYEESDELYEPSQTEKSLGEDTNVNTIEEEHEHGLPEALAARSQINEAPEPTNFGELNTEWDEYEQNRVFNDDEDPNWHQDREDLPTIEDQFARLTDLKACEQLNQESWIRCCRFWKRDPKVTDRDVGVSLEPLKVPLRPYQAFAVWWMLRQERSTAGGGFVADEMGLGKTLEVLAHRITNTWLVIAEKEIKADRAGESTEPKRHLPESHTADDRCPTEPYPFACPCSKWSESCRFEPINSAALIISPKGLLSTWLNEFCRRVDHQHRVGNRLKMWVAHSEGGSLNKNLSKSFNRNMNLRPSINDLQILRRDRQNNTARDGAHFIIVLTTSGSYRSQLRDHIQLEISPAQYNARKKMIKKAVTKPDLLWGFVYRDEFHKEKRNSSGTPSLIRQINHDHGSYEEFPCLWFLSGTPFEKGPSDLEAYIALLESGDWPKSRKFKMYTEEKVKQMGKEFETLVKHPGSMQNHQGFISRFSDLLTLFMIRRTSQTDWFGQELVKLPIHESRDIRCALDSKYAANFQEFQAQIREKIEQEFLTNLQRWRDTGSKGTQPVLSVKSLVGASYKARICATFPYLAKLLAENIVDLRWSQILNENWHLNPEDSPYSQHLDAIIGSSKKVVEIEKILDDLKTDVRGNPEKLVILSIAPTVAFILYLWLKDMKGYKTALFHSGLRLAERSDIKMGFQDDIDTDTGNEAVTYHPRIIVGTIEVLGVGHQLTRAFRIILTEPDHLFSNEYQAIKRINRIGQENKKTYSYRLYCEESEVEMLIVKRQDARKALHDAVMAITQEGN